MIYSFVTCRVFRFCALLEGDHCCKCFAENWPMTWFLGFFPKSCTFSEQVGHLSVCLFYPIQLPRGSPGLHRADPHASEKHFLPAVLWGMFGWPRWNISHPRRVWCSGSGSSNDASIIPCVFFPGVLGIDSCMFLRVSDVVFELLLVRWLVFKVGAWLGFFGVWVPTWMGFRPVVCRMAPPAPPLRGPPWSRRLVWRGVDVGKRWDASGKENPNPFFIHFYLDLAKAVSGSQR